MPRGRFELDIDQVFASAKAAEVVAKLEDELSSFARIIDEHYEFKLFLEDPRIAAGYKKKMLKKLYPPKMTRDFTDLIERLVDNGREELVAPLAQGITKRLFKEAGLLFGEVTSAVPVPKAEQEKLGQVMAALQRRPVKLRYGVKTELLGGLVINFINGEVWDASLKHKLAGLKEAVLK